MVEIECVNGEFMSVGRFYDVIILIRRIYSDITKRSEAMLFPGEEEGREGELFWTGLDSTRLDWTGLDWTDMHHMAQPGCLLYMGFGLPNTA